MKRRMITRNCRSQCNADQEEDDECFSDKYEFRDDNDVDAKRMRGCSPPIILPPLEIKRELESDGDCVPAMVSPLPLSPVAKKKVSSEKTISINIPQHEEEMAHSLLYVEEQDLEEEARKCVQHTDLTLEGKTSELVDDDISQAASILVQMKMALTPLEDPNMLDNTEIVDFNEPFIPRRYHASRGYPPKKNRHQHFDFAEEKIQTESPMSMAKWFLSRRTICADIAQQRPSSYVGRPFANRLAMQDDPQELNSLHCFVRAELLEIFTVPGPSLDSPQSSRQICAKPDDGSLSEEDEDHQDDAEDDDDDEDITTGDLAGRSAFAQCLTPSSLAKSNKLSISSSRLFPGRVGLRCVFCGTLHRRERSTGATMSSFYPRSVSDIYRSVCTWQRVHFRRCGHVPEETRKVYHELKEKDRTRGKTKYWIKSALELGLVNVDGLGKSGIRFIEFGAE